MSGCGKGSVPSEVAAQVPFPITLNDRFQNITPTVGTVDIFAELVEQE